MLLSFGDFVFDPERQVLRKNGALLKVDPQQLALLACFATRAGQLLTREEILEAVWEGRAVTGSALSVAVAKLRKVLGGEGKQTFIENRYGRGYRFIMPVVTLDAPTEAAVSVQQLGSNTPLVGREELCNQLIQAMESCRTGQGAMCTLIGEAGIGKTRVAEVLEQAAHVRGIRCAWARYNAAEGAPPLFSFLQALRELNLEGIADEVLAGLTTLAQWEPAASPLSAAGQLSEELRSDSSAAVHRLLDQISQSLSRLSQVQPLLVIVDDVHWADAASLRLLSYLLNDLSRMHALFVITLRAADLAAGDPRQVELVRILSHRRCERHELPRLCEPDVARYVSAHFGAAPADLAHAVYIRSEGNPFYMVELLRPWSGHESPPSPDQLRYPGLALDSMRKRLAELPAGSRAALSVASVIGHDFDLGLLSRVTGENADHLLEELDSSLANETIVASAHALGSFAFAHELIREVLYGELSASERCRMHLQVGQALEERRTAGINVPSAELAHHFLSALPYGEIGYAIGHARAAARASLRMAANADARALLWRALRALGHGHEPEPASLSALWLELALVERNMGHPQAREHLLLGVKLAREHRLGSLLATAGQLLSPSPGILMRAEANDVLEAAREALPESELALRATVLTHLAWTPPNSMSRRRVQALLDEAERLLSACDARAAVDAWSTLRQARLFFLCGPATQREAEQVAQAIERDLSEREGMDREGRGVALSDRWLVLADSRMLMAMQRGDTYAMQVHLEQHHRTLGPLNNVELDWHWERIQVVMRMNRGEFAGVAEALEQLRQRAERLRLQARRAVWARDYAQLLFWTGDPASLAPLIRPSLVLATRDSPISRSYKLRAMAEVGLLSEAQQALCSVTEAFLRDLPADRDYLAVLAQIASAVVAVQSREHAAVLYELLLPFAGFYAASIAFENMGSVSFFLGQLARLLGDAEAAFGHLQHAIAHNERCDLRACAIQSQLELAELIGTESAVRDLPRARALLAAAEVAAHERGLTPIVRRIEACGASLSWKVGR